MKVEVNDLVRCDCGAKCGIRGKVLKVGESICIIWNYKRETQESIGIDDVVIEMKASKLSKALE